MLPVLLSVLFGAVRSTDCIGAVFMQETTGARKRNSGPGRCANSGHCGVSRVAADCRNPFRFGLVRQSGNRWGAHHTCERLQRQIARRGGAELLRRSESLGKVGELCFEVDEREFEFIRLGPASAQLS